MPVVTFRVFDTGVGLSSTDPLSTTSGIGLKNIDTRLRRIYGDSAGLKIVSLKNSGCEVAFVLQQNDKKSSTIIVDDEPLARKMIKEYLQDLPEIKIAGDVKNGKQAVKAINEDKPDIFIIDIGTARYGWI